MKPVEVKDDFGDLIEFVDFPKIAEDYCRKVLSGEYPGCGYIRMACQRFLDMLEMGRTNKFEFVWSDAHAIDVCTFAETLPLVEDNFRGVVSFELEPWQIWILCALYGFRNRRGHRFVSECYLEVPRKSAKSVLATAIGLYDIRMENARTPLVLIAASTLEQADRVFTPMRKTIEMDADLRNLYQFEATLRVINCGVNGGTVEKVASIGERQDGWNPSTIILEELHAQNPDVYAVLKSAMGSRPGQLLFQITTAGRNASGLAWDNRKAAIALLEGFDTNFEHFAAIYTLDKEDLEDEDRLYADEQLWLKACPNLGVSFDLSKFHLLARDARRKPQDREEYLRTRLNIWTNAASRLFNIELFRRGERPEMTIDQFAGQKCWIGVDLSTSDDLTAVVALFEMGGQDIALFPFFFMSGDAPLLTDPDHMAMVREWVRRKLISKTDSGAVDQEDVLKLLVALKQKFEIMGIGADPAMAGWLMKRAEEDYRLPVVKYASKPYMMTAPTDDLMAKAHAGDTSHVLYNNSVLDWCFSNAHGERKRDGTILPIKEDTNSLNKIDGMVAAGYANGVRLHPEFMDKVKKPSIYNKPGQSALERMNASFNARERHD